MLLSILLCVCWEESHKVAYNTLFELERLCRKGGKSPFRCELEKRNLFNDFY